MEHQRCPGSLARRIASAFAFASLLALASTDVGASPVNLIKNGSFELNGGNGQIGYTTNLQDWTSTGYNFVFAAGTADTTGAQTRYSCDPQLGGDCLGWSALTLWGANNGSNNGFGASPDGGSFLAADASYDQSPISQTIDGLTAGASYLVSFKWAAAQQYGFDGANTEWWVVNLGADPTTSQATGIASIDSHGFSGWAEAAMTFTATGTSEVLSFLAGGGPLGAPPFVLLDGISMTAVPEPPMGFLFIAGLVLICWSARRRSKSNAT